MRVLLSLALVVVAVYGEKDKTWKELKTCMEETADKCTQKCKPEKPLPGPFDGDKFITCMKETRHTAGEAFHTCLKDSGRDVEKLEASSCWKPEDPEKAFGEVNENVPSKGPPAIRKIIDCAKDCMKDASKTCFEGCTGTEDKKLNEDIKTCMPKAFEAAKPAMKQCLGGPSGPPPGPPPSP